jgi:hypothetical protein
MNAEPIEEWVITIVRRCGRLVSRGLINPVEAVAGLFDEFAWDPVAAVHLAPQVWALLPEPLHTEFIKRVDEALQPGFRRRPFLYGGEHPVTEEKLRREADEQTHRVKAWAEQFRQVLAKEEAPP